MNVRDVFARTNTERTQNKRCSFNCPRPRPSSYNSPNSPSGLLKPWGTSSADVAEFPREKWDAAAEK